MSCGEGFIEVMADQTNHYAKEAKLATIGGARTSLFVPELDRYFLAVRASGNEPAAIWISNPDREPFCHSHGGLNRDEGRRRRAIKRECTSI